MMPERLKYHFEPKIGWMNDPNGLVFFRGKYHAFFQHFPHAPMWGPMHWGHTVSEDLIHWEEMPIALYPDQPYDEDAGCWSGSAVVKDDKLYLFYTSACEELGQTQSMAVSDDGINFVKHENNPIIPHYPEDGSRDFRDPKVSKFGDEYLMVVGSGKDKTGKILLYKSKKLFDWAYAGVLFESAEYGSVFECPDFFQLNGKYILMFSQMGLKTHSTVMLTGDFDGSKFTPLTVHRPEAGPEFYAPQTFLDGKGRHIMIGWLYHWGKKLDKGADYAGALSIPREVKMTDGKLTVFPVEEAQFLLTDSDPFVTVEKNKITVASDGETLFEEQVEDIKDIKFLRDTKTIEGFINGGEASFSVWFGK